MRTPGGGSARSFFSPFSSHTAVLPPPGGGCRKERLWVQAFPLPPQNVKPAPLLRALRVDGCPRRGRGSSRWSSGTWPTAIPSLTDGPAPPPLAHPPLTLGERGSVGDSCYVMFFFAHPPLRLFFWSFFIKKVHSVFQSVSFLIFDYFTNCIWVPKFQTDLPARSAIACQRSHHTHRRSPRAARGLDPRAWIL